MRRLGYVWWALAALLWPAGADAQLPAQIPGDEVPNYRLAAPGLALGGQPSPAFLARTRELGFRTVINLRTLEEGPPAEAEVLRNLGLRYVSLPVTASNFDLATVAAVRTVLDDPAAAPVLLHCSSSNRVGAVIGVIEVQKGVDLETAETEARRAGLTSAPMIEAFRRVAAEVIAARPTPVASPIEAPSPQP